MKLRIDKSMEMTSTFLCTSMEQTFSISERAGCIDGPTSSSKSNASCFFTIKFNCGNEKQTQIYAFRSNDNGNILNGVSRENN